MSAAPSNANAGCVGPSSESAGHAPACAGCPNAGACASGAGRVVDPTAQHVAAALAGVRHKVVVLSGKGGVGKSTVAAQLAWFLAGEEGRADQYSADVGVLDVDICGPSVPRMFGVESEEVHKSSTGWSPVGVRDNLSVMSIGFMLPKKTDAVIWRGPKKSGLIKQFLTQVEWPELDFMVVDTPPGTSDEHISVMDYLSESNVDGAIIVTTPQEIAMLDVRKEITFCKKVGVRVLGVVENMAGFVCPCCSHTSEIFAAANGGAAAMAAEMEVPFLGSLPLDPRLLRACEAGKSFFAEHADEPAAKAFRAVVQKLAEQSPAIAKTLAERRVGHVDEDGDEEM